MPKNDHSIASLLCKYNPWRSNTNRVWLASFLSILRNIDKFNFPSKLSTDKQKIIINLVQTSIEQKALLDDSKYILAEEISPIDKEYLMEHFLSAEGFYQAHAGEAFIIDKTGEFLATVNIHDHLHLSILDTSGNLENRWNHLVKIEAKIGEKLNYSFSPRFGFLTADLTLCGTGIQIMAYLQLPALIHTETIDDILTKIVDESIIITGLHGSPTEVIGDILIIKNNFTLGTTEEQTLATIENITTKLIVEENSKRLKIKQEDNSEIKDRISRAYGILMHSYQIEAVEALNALSLIKLGIDLDWVSEITVQELNYLFFNCRRAHLICECNKKVTKEELPHKRAKYIRELLKKVKLTI